MQKLITIVVVGIIAVVFVRLAEIFWQPIRTGDFNTVSNSPADPIDMVEPNGFPKRDQQYADTNKDNAQAEIYRAQAELLYAQARDLDNRAILYPAEAELLRSQAYAIRQQADATMLLAQAEYSKSPAGGVSIFKDGMGTGVQQGRSTAFRDVIIFICACVIGLLLLAISRKS